jgi:hypothetical protein
MTFERNAVSPQPVFVLRSTSRTVKGSLACRKPEASSFRSHASVGSAKVGIQISDGSWIPTSLVLEISNGLSELGAP